jgi:hypothetical protein
MYNKTQKKFFFFVAGKLPTFLLLLTYRFESQYHSEYLIKRKIKSMEREWYKETVDSTRKISERSMVIG